MPLNSGTAAIGGVFTQTYSPLRMPRSLAAFGLISTNISCCSSASQGLERVSSPPPSYSTRRPLVMISGKVLPMSLFFSCTVLYSVGRRQKAFLSSCVGYLATRSGRVAVQRLAVLRDRVGEVPHHRARLGVAERVAAVRLHRHADDAAGRVGLPVLALGGLLLGVGQVVPPAQLLQQHVVELGVAGGDVGALAVRAVVGQQRLPRRARRRSWRGSCRRRPSRAWRCRTGSGEPGCLSSGVP